MIEAAKADLPAALSRMRRAETVCYCPCSGRDVGFALAHLGAFMDRFVFCDRGCRRPQMTGREAVPDGWLFVGRVSGAREPDRVPPRQPVGGEVIEAWLRPDGSLATLEFRATDAKALLAERFADRTISALLHINDGTGEGGSDLWFLGSPGNRGTQASRCLLSLVAERLTDEALVITDGAMTDPEFKGFDAFQPKSCRA